MKQGYFISEVMNNLKLLILNERVIFSYLGITERNLCLSVCDRDNDGKLGTILTK